MIRLGTSLIEHACKIQVNAENFWHNCYREIVSKKLNTISLDHKLIHWTELTMFTLDIFYKLQVNWIHRVLAYLTYFYVYMHCDFVIIKSTVILWLCAFYCTLLCLYTLTIFFKCVSIYKLYKSWIVLNVFYFHFA